MDVLKLFGGEAKPVMLCLKCRGTTHSIMVGYTGCIVLSHFASDFYNVYYGI